MAGWLATPCYWEVEEGQKSIPLNQHIKHCFNDVVVCLFFLFRLLVVPKIGWRRRKREKLSRHLLRRGHDRVSWLFHGIFSSFSWSSECMQAQLITTSAFNSSSASRLLACLHPFRYSRLENHSFVRPIVASIPESMFTRKNNTAFTSIVCAVIQQGGC